MQSRKISGRRPAGETRTAHDLPILPDYEAVSEILTAEFTEPRSLFTATAPTFFSSQYKQPALLREKELSW